jgi:hypothetical protein
LAEEVVVRAINRRLKWRRRRKTRTIGPYLRYRKWSGKGDNRQERLKEVE